MADRNLLYNGDLTEPEKITLETDSDWMRYAPGFFDSMRVHRATISLWPLHFARMQRAAAWWNLPLPAEKYLLEALERYIAQTSGNGKLRMQWMPKAGKLEYLASFEPRDTTFRFPENGLHAGIYKDRVKWVTDSANLKTNQRDIYLQARNWAAVQGYDEALVINQQGRIADSTICNVFWIMGNVLYTPTLHAGGVEGVMREFILKELPAAGWHVVEQDAFPAQLEIAEEIFLTNALSGILPVASIGSYGKPTDKTRKLFDQFLSHYEPNA